MQGEESPIRARKRTEKDMPCKPWKSRFRLSLLKRYGRWPDFAHLLGCVVDRALTGHRPERHPVDTHDLGIDDCHKVRSAKTIERLVPGTWVKPRREAVLAWTTCRAAS